MQTPLFSPKEEALRRAREVVGKPLPPREDVPGLNLIPCEKLMTGGPCRRSSSMLVWMTDYRRARPMCRRCGEQAVRTGVGLRLFAAVPALR